jgi:hypothetical protein
MTTLEDLTPELKRALIAFSPRIGAGLPRGMEPHTVVALRQHFLVSPGGNLTGLGEKLRTEAVDEALEAW